MSCKCGGTMKWIGGLLTGAVFGAAAALLLAPKSGEETRTEITESIQNKYYEVYDAVLAFGEKVTNQIAGLKEDFDAFSAKAKKEDDFEFDDAFEDDADSAVEAEEADEPAEEAEVAEEQPKDEPEPSEEETTEA